MKMFSILLMLLLFSSGAVKSANQEDERVTAALEKISQTTPEDREMLSKVQDMRPVVNGCKSTKSLIELVQDYSFNKGDYNIFPIGWFAAQKKLTGNWQIMFYYKDYTKTYQAAEWEFNPQTKELYPFELNIAPLFWTGVGRKKPCSGRIHHNS